MKKDSSEAIVEAVIFGLQEKKGCQLVKINLKEIENSVAKRFVICHGTSNSHIQALADSVVEEVKNKTGVSKIGWEGYQNAEWILIDFADVVVHVFKEDIRRFYKLEELWADAVICEISND